MIDWGRVPWTLWIYVVLEIFGGVLQVMLAVDFKHVPALVLFVAIMLGWAYLLLRGVRWVWIATLVAFALAASVEIAAFGPRTWWGAVSGLIGFTLLLAPQTRRYFQKPVLADA